MDTIIQFFDSFGFGALFDAIAKIAAAEPVSAALLVLFFGVCVFYIKNKTNDTTLSNQTREQDMRYVRVLRAELSAMGDKHSQIVERIGREHRDEIAKINAAHRQEITKLNQAHRTEIERYKKQIEQYSLQLMKAINELTEAKRDIDKQKTELATISQQLQQAQNELDQHHDSSNV